MPPKPAFTPSNSPATSSRDRRHRSLPDAPIQVGSRKRQGKRMPIITLRAFIAAHDDKRLIRYAAEPPRRDSVLVGRDVLNELTDDGIYPHANNSTARIAWARTAEAEARQFAASKPDHYFYFGTLVLAEFMVPYDDARSVDVRDVQESARRRFKGLNFLGVVEAALYTETAQLTARGRHVCWHVHFVAWDLSEDRIRRARDRINRNNSCFVPGIEPAHYRPLDRDELPSAVFYMFKGPQSDHRVFARVREYADADTGELLKRPTGRFTQAKGALRLGDAARMANLLEGLRLDELAFANGVGGRGLLKRIADRALAPLRAYERRRQNRFIRTAH